MSLPDEPEPLETEIDDSTWVMIFYPFTRVVCTLFGGTDDIFSIEVCNRLGCVAEDLLFYGAADNFEFCWFRLDINNDKPQRHATHIDLDLDTDAETQAPTAEQNKEG